MEIYIYIYISIYIYIYVWSIGTWELIAVRLLCRLFSLAQSMLLAMPPKHSNRIQATLPKKVEPDKGPLRTTVLFQGVFSGFMLVWGSVSRGRHTEVGALSLAMAETTP